MTSHDTPSTGAALPASSLAGKTALVTGSSRGIGASVAKILAAAGARVAINYRSKAPRATKLLAEIEAAGGAGILAGGDLTNDDERQGAFAAIRDEFGTLDVLVLNASGGMERGMGEDYALRLNRDAQLATLDAALELMSKGGRVVFVTSHQAHFIRTTPTMPEYEGVALSKRAGEDALRARIDELEARGIAFVVVSGDMIEGTITATLLQRANPDAIAQRRASSGKLYDVDEFAFEVASAVVDDVPSDNERLVGDITEFLANEERAR